jgi:hypothetical protein
MTPTEVTEKLGLLRMKDRSWYCHPSNALNGDGLFEGAFVEVPTSSAFSTASLLRCRIGIRSSDVDADAVGRLTGLNWLSQNIKAQK